jgi:hypothetical protein
MISLFVDLFVILWFLRVTESLRCICIGAVAQGALDVISRGKLCSHSVAFGCLYSGKDICVVFLGLYIRPTY